MKMLDKRQVRLAVLHHSAHEPAPNSDGQTELSRIKSWHLDRFNDIGYHFVIFDKVFMAGRPLPRMGAHCKHWNRYSVGFCVCGDLTKRSPTNSEVSATVAAIRVAERFIGHNLAVVGHNQLAKTLCPGVDLVHLVNTALYRETKYTVGEL